MKKMKKNIRMNNWLSTGLKNSLYAENLKKALQEKKGMSIDKLSKNGNFIIRGIDPHNYNQERKYKFQEKNVLVETNILKQFLYTDIHVELSRGQKDNLCNQLEYWKYHLGRDPETGEGKGYPLPGQEDVEHLFPTLNLTELFKSKGWITPELNQSKKPTGHFLMTSEGMKLGKVKNIVKNLLPKQNTQKFEFIEEE